jgi:hypothetical protein
MRSNYTSSKIDLQPGASPAVETAEGGKPPVSLGNTYTYCFHNSPEAENRRILRYILQAAIQELLPEERVAICLKMIAPGHNSVKVLYSERVKRAHYGNLCICGSVWVCPVCSSKITEKRRVELAAGLAGWKGGCLMGAYTMQHNRGDGLRDLRELMAGTYRKMQQGREWQEIKEHFGIIGTITSSEVTWGQVSGWHPHRHALALTREPVALGDIAEIEKTISKRFRDLLSKAGGFGNEDFSVKFSNGDTPEGASSYVAKWGLSEELTKGTTKKGRDGNLSPFEIVAWGLATDEKQPKELFREYHSAFKRSKQLTYSWGLRKLLALGAEKSDLQLAEEQVEDAVVIAELAREAWAVICKQGKRGELLEVASTGDAEQIAGFLQDLGIYL